MPFESKDKEQLVNDAIISILEKNPDIDFSDGEPLRTFIEAVMNEIDLQYWQMEQVYNNSFIDTSYDEDLTNLVKILGISRFPAYSSTGKVKFYRETPATMDYTIPAGTLVETLPNSDNEIIRFETTESVILLTGQTEIYANIKSVEPGLKSNVIANKITIINNPPLGIEFVINEEAVIGGEDEEADENLRVRASLALETSGLGTVNALTNKIAATAGIKSVKVLDMERGIGTVDILVLGDALPMPSTKMTEITLLAAETKAGGIDVILYEPTVTTINLDITLILNADVVLADVTSLVNTAINNYFASLHIGDSLIRNQLSKEILINTKDKVIDLTINTPSTNTTVSATGIIVLGTTTLHWWVINYG